MGVRFTGTYGTTYYNQITVEIHDEDDAGSEYPLNFTDSGLMEKSEGEWHDKIKPTHYKCTIYLDSAETEAFFDDLIEAEEGRFHLLVKRGSTLLFKGRIIVDGMVKDDALKPTFSFTAIDGVTLLKNVKYSITSAPADVGPIVDVIHQCLYLSDVTNKMYADTDNLLCVASNLQFNDPYFDGVAFYENAWNKDYYFKLDGNKEERLTAWEVLMEVLTKYGLFMRYWKGVYYVFSVEYPGETWNAANGYKKNRDGVAILIPAGTVNIDTLALSGGKYHFENGLKQVQINAKKEFANAYFGENFIWIKTNTAYQNIGVLVHDIKYKGLITLDVTKLILEATGPYPPFFSVKMWVKETNLSTSAVTYLRTSTQQIKHSPLTVFQLDNYGASVDHTEIAYVLQTGKFETQFKFPQVTYDRSIEISFQFYQYLKYDYTVISGSPQVNSLDYNYKVKVGEDPLSTATDIYFRATVDGDNVRELNMNILAPDYNGNDYGKTYFFDGGGSSEYVKSTNEWRYTNAESWGPLEPAICRKMLEYFEGNLVKLMIPCNIPTVVSENIGIPTIYLTKFSYKSVTYYTTGIDIDHFNDIIRLTGIKVNTKSTKTITAYNVRANETSPEGKETAGDTSNFGSYNEYQKGKLEEHVMDVVGNDLQIDYAIPTGSSFSSIRQSISVFVEGVRWRHVSTLVTDNANRATYSLEDDGLITFHPYIPNKKVIVQIENYFEIGISS